LAVVINTRVPNVDEHFWRTPRNFPIGKFCISERVVPLFRPYLAGQNWVNDSSVNLLH
jgi:hypothetical protein